MEFFSSNIKLVYLFIRKCDYLGFFFTLPVLKLEINLK